MQFLNAPPNKNRRNQGFTTIEMIITLIIVGILAAVATPSFLEANARSQVNETVSKIQGALLEAQTQAIRSGRNGCQITITTKKEDTIGPDYYRAITYTGTAPPAGESPCLLNSRIFPLETIINFDRRNQQVVNFSFKGTITTGSAFTLWVTHEQFFKDDEAPCLVLSAPLGVIRTGFLDGGECTR
jgi:prepilin-type N-terminal cleavage/methylation domain-containing protein